MTSLISHPAVLNALLGVLLFVAITGFIITHLVLAYIAGSLGRNSLKEPNTAEVKAPADRFYWVSYVMIRDTSSMPALERDGQPANLTGYFSSPIRSKSGPIDTFALVQILAQRHETSAIALVSISEVEESQVVKWGNIFTMP